MREIVLDTETTGLDARTGDRIIEIGCVELLNRIPTGAEYHCYINPERDVPAEAVAVHGLTAEFLADKPLFADVVDPFLDFLGEARLIIHNAAFDLGFLNAEFERAGRPTFGRDRTVDTLMLARRKFPGGGNRLDDLCARFGIDNSRRDKHGALLDSQLLAEVYLELLGGRQADLSLDHTSGGYVAPKTARARPEPLPPRLTKAEIEAHRAFIASLGENALWTRIWRSETDGEA